MIMAFILFSSLKAQLFLLLRSFSFLTSPSGLVGVAPDDRVGVAPDHRVGVASNGQIAAARAAAGRCMVSISPPHTNAPETREKLPRGIVRLLRGDDLVQGCDHDLTGRDR